jgi:ubiquitin-protein ligase
VFLRRQFEAAQALVRDTDLVSLLPLETSGGPPDRYLAEFRCQGLVRQPSGAIEEANLFEFGIWFPAHYLRRPDPQVVTLLRPWNVFHPNIFGPICCIGKMAPGTTIVDLVYQIFEILVYRNWAAHDGLNQDACQWARNNQHRFPIDPRPLKRKSPRGREAAGKQRGQP